MRFHWEFAMLTLIITDRAGRESVRQFGKDHADLAFEASQAWIQLGFSVRFVR